jgi:hypothetical protein
MFGYLFAGTGLGLNVEEKLRKGVTIGGERDREMWVYGC